MLLKLQKNWPSKQHLEKDILLTRLSNKISILQVRLDSYKKELLVYQDMFKSSSSEPELELEFNSDYCSE